MTKRQLWALVQRQALIDAAAKIRSMDAGVVRMSGRRVSDIDLVADLIDPEVS
ncbi:hypothetical protein [Streptomyces cyaneofuscatus]|uniref:hypothetical protein n=1 Tax=Streptomyces cyaneofuscatus TaxID=66883 RepID=UPI0034486AB4